MTSIWNNEFPYFMMLYVWNPLYGVFAPSPKEDIFFSFLLLLLFSPPSTHTDTSRSAVTLSVCFLFSPCLLTSLPIVGIVLYLVFASMYFSLGLVFVFYPLLFAFIIDQASSESSYGPIHRWDTSRVTALQGTWCGCTVSWCQTNIESSCLVSKKNFNGNVSSWDECNVTFWK